MRLATVDVEEHSETARIELGARLCGNALQRSCRDDRHRLALNLAGNLQLHQPHLRTGEVREHSCPRTVDGTAGHDLPVIVELHVSVGHDAARQLTPVA
jgi:hypothetical protein